jgi:4'-phosphopantetheinyl transferase
MSTRPPLNERATHVWRIQVDRPDEADALVPLLSETERQRANSCYFAKDRTRFVIAHGMLRRILAGYAGIDADALSFDAGEFGKPSLRSDHAREGLEFNLSHSGDLALLAVSESGPVGVDIQRWDERAELLDIASRFFSTAECESLRTLAGSPSLVIDAFYAAWSRKEAYLKATGHGVSRGLQHFDVTLSPAEPARLLADRLDPLGVTRWVLASISVTEGYSAALCVAAPLGEIVVLDAV